MAEISKEQAKEELIKKFEVAEKELGRIPSCTKLEMYGMPPVAKYNQMFGSWGKFLISIGRPFKQKGYTRKTNPKRFFYPQEYMKVLNLITNEKHKFWVEFLIHTGMRIDEARNVQIKDIDFERKTILIKKPKRSLGRSGKERNIQISTYLYNRITSYAKNNSLGKNSNFSFPSTQFFDRIIKNYCKEGGIADYGNFSAHNLRKTLETWCAAGLNINILILTAHFGHTIDVAGMHYVGLSLLTQDDKVLIRTILDDLFNIK